MDKLEIVRCLRLANDLWSIQGANPFSIRAHERSATAIWESALPVDEIVQLPPGTIPGVGKETIAMVQTLQDGGFEALLDRLQVTIPVQAAELVGLPGIGPKTAHHLVFDLCITSAAELARALESGRLQHVPGLGPAKLARLRRDLPVFLERGQAVPIALAWPVAAQLSAELEDLPGVIAVSVAGGLRRGAVTTPYVPLIVATDDPTQLFDWLNRQGAVAGNDREFTLTVRAGMEDVTVRILLTAPSKFAQTLMRMTGDETHQQVIEGMLTATGIIWRADGLERTGPAETATGTATEQRPVEISVRDEADIYDLVGLQWLPPEIREGEGILRDPSTLIDLADIRGDLHVHSTWSDGSQSIREIADRASALGYEYIAITDHSQSLTVANGLTPERVAAQRDEIAQVQAEIPVRILHGTEVDILSDGQLDLPTDTLFDLDIVVASVHSAMQQSRAQMTERILRAIEHPAVHIIGHLTGRILGRRSGYEVDIEAILKAAAKHGVMVELNANPNRLDISDVWLRRAQDLGLLIPIDTDAHHQPEFANMAYGVRMARRGWLQRDTVLNTLPLEDLLLKLGKRRQH